MARQAKRILFVSHTAEITGPAHSLHALLRQIKDKYDVAVVIPEDGPLCEWLARDGVPVYILPEQRARGITRMVALLRREDFDLVYGNNPSTYARNALIAARLLGRPFIWHFRSIKWHWGWREGIFLRGASRVIAVSHACAEPLLRFISAGKVAVIHNGVEVSGFQHDRQAARQALLAELGLPVDAQVLISVGHLKLRKGQAEQAEVMRRLADRYPRVHLVMVGNLTREPDYATEVKNRIAQFGLQDRIHLLGLRQDVPQLLAAADIYIHTPKRDAHPRGVIEAMAAGLPVVAFAALGGVAETVANGQTGFLIEPGDCAAMSRAIGTLLDSPGRLAAQGEQGRRHVQAHFSAAGTAEKIDRVLGELLAAG